MWVAMTELSGLYTVTKRCEVWKGCVGGTWGELEGKMGIDVVFYCIHV